MNEIGYEIRAHVVQASQNEPIYHPSVAAALSGLSLDELDRACQEGLISPKVLPDGSVGYTRSDIYQLSRIHRLREDLGLDWDALVTVMHLRAQVLRMRREVDLLRQLLARRQEELFELLQSMI